MSTHVVFLAAASEEVWNQAMQRFFNDHLGNRFRCANIHPDFFDKYFSRLFPSGTEVLITACYAAYEEVCEDALLYKACGADSSCEIRSGKFVTDEKGESGTLHFYEATWGTLSGETRTFKLY